MPANNNAFRERLETISGGYRASQILFTANRLELFTRLGRNEMTALELAQTLDTDPRATRILCDALAALGLLDKELDRYRNVPGAFDYLMSDAPTAQNALLWHGAGLYERWGKLYDVMRSGQPAPREAMDVRLIGNEQAFARAMASSGSLGARETAEKVDLTGACTMLDIGGGPGVYAIEFVRQNPQFHAVILDNEKTLSIAQAHIEQAALSERISVRAGDALKDDLGQGYDFILLSNVIHAYGPETNLQLLSRATKALAPGGRIGIKEFFLNPDRTSPEWACLFAVNMLVATEGGDCYTVAEVRDWFIQVGLVFDREIELTPPSRMVLGKAVG
jgi:predicted O-methyltransferase YrrM